MRLKGMLAAIMAAIGFGTVSATPAAAASLEDTIYLELKDGRVVIELRPDLAPKHVQRIKELTRAKFYDGIAFHRVIEGFMAQTGDPTGTGAGGSDKPDLQAEFSAEKHLRGTLSMARSNNPNSANSQPSGTVPGAAIAMLHQPGSKSSQVPIGRSSRISRR